MFSKVSIAALIAGTAVAYTPPTTQLATGNAINAPLVEVVPACKPYTIKWSSLVGDSVAILLLKGPSSNVVFNQVVVDDIPNSGSFVWNVPAGLEATEGPGGYGLQIVNKADGKFQYSTQFGISNAACAEPPKSSSVAPTSSAVSSSSAAPLASETVSGYAVETPVPSSSSYEVPQVNSTSCTTTTTQYVAPPVGTGSVNSTTVVYPTGPLTVPSSLLTTATSTPSASGPSPPEFTGAASGLQAGLGLAGAVAAAVLML